MLKIKAPNDFTTKTQDLTGTAILWTQFYKENFRPMLVEIVENKTCVQVYNPNTYPHTFVKGDLFGYVDLWSCGVKYDVYDRVFKLKPPTVMTMQPIFAGEQEKTKALQTHLHRVCEPWKAHLPKAGEDQWPWLDKNDPKRQKTDVEILRDQVRLPTHLDEQMVAKLFADMTEHIEAFSLRNEVGTCPFYEVHLSLTDDTPFFIRPYDLKQEFVAVMDKEVDSFVKRGILVQGHTGYVSPVKLIEWKAKNEWRMIADFRHLNKRLARLQHAFPLVRDVMAALVASNSNVFSLFDLKDAYFSLLLALLARQYCGIVPRHGASTYMFTRLSMGLSISPAVWQQFINNVFRELPAKDQDHFKVIMDDVLVFSLLKDHHRLLKMLYALLRKYGLKISPHKCQLYQTRIEYMGIVFEIVNDKPSYVPMKSKCEAIRNLLCPGSITEVRKFCRMVNFLSSFLKDLRKTLMPIYNLLQKRTPFNWMEECQIAFDTIKQQLANPPTL